MPRIMERPVSIFKTFLDLVLPPVCYVCGKSCSSKYGLCEECLDKVKRERRLNTAERIDGNWSCCYYKNTVKDCIHLFKYKGYAGLVDIFRDIMVDFIEKNEIQKQMDLIVPVPMYPAKRRERTYNHAEILASSVSKALAIPMDAKNLRKMKWTTSQSELDRIKRLKNVRGSFLAVDKKAFSGKRVLLIDDVYTTGATINECARVLLAAKADRVSSLTLARG
ncbi:MAG: ComF family protein [Candidatus Omnitrophota bacterium]